MGRKKEQEGLTWHDDSNYNNTDTGNYELTDAMIDELFDHRDAREARKMRDRGFTNQQIYRQLKHVDQAMQDGTYQEQQSVTQQSQGHWEKRVKFFGGLKDVWVED